MAKSHELTETQQKWLAQRLKRKKTKPTSFEITPQTRPDILPLSFAQQRLWFLDQWEPGSAAYLLPYRWHLKGPLNVPALETSLSALLVRHESLRTTFPAINGHPVQIIHLPEPCSLALSDLTMLLSPQKEVELQRRIEEEASHAIDLAKGPLWRAQLLRLTPEDHYFLVTLHHIITDAWSMELFWQEVAEAYTAIITRQSPTFQTLPIQYVDFALWQRNVLQGELLEQQIQYWQEQLRDLTPLFLLSKAPRPSQQTYHGASLRFDFSPTLVRELSALSRQEGVTVFMTLLSVFQVLLAHYTGQEDIAVGSPISNRTQTGLERMHGFFVNTLVLRTTVSGSLTVRELIHQVRETCLEAYSHQDVPFEKLVEMLQPVRDPSRHPLVQTMFQVIHHNSLAPFPLSGLAVTNIPLSTHSVNFDLQVAFLIQDDTMMGHLLFNPDLFTSEMMDQFNRHFQKILKEMIRDPEQRLAQIPMLEDRERDQQLNEWNDTVREFPREASLPLLFETQTAQTPDSIAVVCEDRQLTYIALNRQANQLALYLMRQGVKPDTRIGVYLERSEDLLISLLAILKIGGVYVPLDQHCPLERLTWIIAHAEIAVVITYEASRQTLPSTVDMIMLDCLNAVLSRESSTLIPRQISSQSLASIMYTSGSTGQPKGIFICQQSIVRLVKGTDFVQLGETDRVGHLANVAFDAMTFEIWGALLNGATVVIFNQEKVLNPVTCVARIQQQEISVLFLTTSLFNQLARETPTAFSSVETVLFGGEQADPRCVRTVLEAAPPSRLLHVYGPTESTTFSTWHLVNIDDQQKGIVPIGRPIANTQVYVVDASQQLVPNHVQGEMLIGGEGLAWGYLKQPSLTALNFVPHPWSQKPGVRLYRTGDHVCWRHGGILEFLGRKDTQIKLRGYRIELGEIQEVFSQYPLVKETIVLCREYRPGEKQLVAYIVPRPEFVENDLRDFLKKRLPRYMIPGMFIMVEAIPLTPNGKIDQARLPIPHQTKHQQAKDEGRDQLSPLETQLVVIWEQTLGISKISIHDNFFEIGGHSLMAANIFSQIEKIYHKKIPISILFQFPTIHELCHVLSEQGLSPEWAALISIQPHGSLPPFFAVSGVGGNVVSFSTLAHLLGPQQPFYGFQSRGLDGKTEPFTQIEAMASYYIQEMQSVQPSGPYFIGGQCIGGVIAFEMSQQLLALGEKVALLVLMDTWPPPPKPSAIVLVARAFILKHAYSLSYGWKWVRSQFHLLKNGISTLEFTKWADHQKKLFRRLTKGGNALAEKKALIKLDRVSYANRFALSQYSLREYPGRTVHFIAKDRPLTSTHDPRQIWERLCTGEYQTYEILAKDSGGLLNAPGVQTFASRLQKILETFTSKDLHSP